MKSSVAKYALLAAFLLDLTPFTEPGLPPLRLRFRLFPDTMDDRWLIDDVRAEALPTPSLFELPFQDDVEGWRKWDATGGWARTDEVAHSPRLAWQADTPGATLTLAGALDLREVVSPTLTFWYTMQTDGEGMVEVSTDDGATWQPAATITETTDWTQAGVGLSAWAGLTARLRLRHTGQTGGTWAVDDFAVREVVPPVVHPLPFGDDMETPEANWRAVNAWQPVTTTAHSDTRAWRGYAGDSALILVDRLDLSETVSPTLTFWQQFALPEGSTGQVMASADGGLTWEAVLTITEPILDWAQVEVNLSDYAGREIGLAFHLSKVTTETVGGQAGYIGEPGGGIGRLAEGGRIPSNGGIGTPALALSALAVSALAVIRQCKRPHRKWAWVALGLSMVISLGCGIGYNIPATPHYSSENRLQDILGEVEPVVLAEREPLAAEVSPDGQWLIVVMEHEQRFNEWIAIDLVHNVEHVLATRDGGSSGLVWLDNQHAVMTMGGGLSMLRVPDLNRWHLTNLRSPSSDPVTDLGILWKADYLYVVEGEFSSGYAVFSIDEDLPYYVSMSTVWLTQEDVETALAGIPHTIIQTRRSFAPDARYYSPDGRYYIAERPFRDPGSFMTYGQGAMFDAATEKEAAHAYKHYWNTYFLGWAYDSSGAYFMFLPRTADADILHPRHPIYKLLVPGAKPGGTPVPMYTPTPTSEGGVPPGVTLVPLDTPTPEGSRDDGRALAARSDYVGWQIMPASYSQLMPLAETVDGWYIDDVTVQDVTPPDGVVLIRHFFDDMESGTDKWQTEGTWAPITTTAHSAVTCWTDSPQGNYQHGTNAALTMAADVDLSSAANARLTFWDRYSLAAYDHGYVEVSTDGGQTWTSVFDRYYSSNTGWTKQTVDLSDYLGQQIRVRFRLDALSHTNVADGWYVDDVAVEEVVSLPVYELPFSDDMEDTVRWEAEGTWGPITTTAWSGVTAWADSPEGNYQHGSDTSLVLKGSVELSGTVAPQLTFWDRYSLAAYDHGYAEVSTDGGYTWTGVFDRYYSSNIGWTKQTVDLSAYAGQRVKIRFRLDARSHTDVADGWTIDDVAIEEAPVQVISLPFYDDVESGTDNWEAEGTWGLITTTARSGVMAWTDSPDGDYQHGSDTSLVLKAQVELTGTVAPQLTFWDRYTLAAYDYGYVEVSTDGGYTWTGVFNRYYSSNIGWTKQTVDLSAYAGQRVKVRFRLDALSHVNVSDGWYVDDVRIEEAPTQVIPLPFYDDMEGGTDNWEAEGTWGPIILGAR